MVHINNRRVPGSTPNSGFPGLFELRPKFLDSCHLFSFLFTSEGSFQRHSDWIHPDLTLCVPVTLDEKGLTWLVRSLSGSNSQYITCYVFIQLETCDLSVFLGKKCKAVLSHLVLSHIAKSCPDRHCDSLASRTMLGLSKKAKSKAKCLNKTSLHGSQNQANGLRCWSVLLKSGLRHTGSCTENTASQFHLLPMKCWEKKSQAGYLIKRRMRLPGIWQ